MIRFISLLAISAFLTQNAASLEWKNCGNSRQYVLMHKSAKTVSVRFNQLDLHVVKEEPSTTQTIDGLLASNYGLSPIGAYKPRSRDRLTGQKAAGLNDHTKERSVRRRIDDEEMGPAQAQVTNSQAPNFPPQTMTVKYFTPKPSVPWWENTMGFTSTLPYDQRPYGQHIANIVKSTKPVIRITSFNVTVDGVMDGPQDVDFNNWTVKLDVKKVLLSFLPLPIPCIAMSPVSVGSCTYNVCDIIRNYIGPNCQTFNNPKAPWNALVPCGCPILPGTYGLENIVVGIPPELLSFLEGEYELMAKVMDANSNEIGCFSMRLKI